MTYLCNHIMNLPKDYIGNIIGSYVRVIKKIQKGIHN
jgi:hypothetical protein